MNNQPLLLIIDDEISILKTLKDALEDENYRVETLSDGGKVLDTVGKLIPDIIFLDIFMPNYNGIEILKKIKEEYPNQKVIMISGFGNIPIAIEAIKFGAIDFIEKPLNLDEILAKLNFLKNNQNIDFSQNKISINDLEKFEIVGKSYLFLELIEQVNNIVKLNLPVMIYGSHGTGKTKIAEYIHAKSNLALDPFFVFNCESLSVQDLNNKIDDAFKNDRATIFLKNIDKSNPETQKKLLYYIENNFNSNKYRIIVSSCSSLYNLLSVDKFNSSLFHKLNITPIEIPSLNKRRHDIPILVDFYLKKINKKYNKNLIFDSNSIRSLRNLNWKENISELIFLIEKIVSSNISSNQIVTRNVLFAYLSEVDAQIIEEQAFYRFESLQHATAEFEKSFLLFLLKKNKYDVQQVSNRLNLTMVQLKDKMSKLNIDVKI